MTTSASDTVAPPQITPTDLVPKVKKYLEDCNLKEGQDFTLSARIVAPKGKTVKRVTVTFDTGRHRDTAANYIKGMESIFKGTDILPESLLKVLVVKPPR